MTAYFHLNNSNMQWREREGVEGKCDIHPWTQALRLHNTLCRNIKLCF